MGIYTNHTQTVNQQMNATYGITYRMDSHAPSGSSSSLTGPSRECPSQAKDSSTSLARCTRPRSSLDRRDQLPSTAGRSAVHQCYCALFTFQCKCFKCSHQAIGPKRSSHSSSIERSPMYTAAVGRGFVLDVFGRCAYQMVMMESFPDLCPIVGCNLCVNVLLNDYGCCRVIFFFQL